MLGIPLILGAVSISHVPAAVEAPGEGSDLVSQNPLPEAPDPQSPPTTNLFPELLFKSPLPPDARQTPQSPDDPSLPNSASKTEPTSSTDSDFTSLPKAPPLFNSDFFKTPLPPEISNTVSPLNSPGLFPGFSDLTNYTQIRRKGPFLYSLRINTSAVYDDNSSLSKTNKKHGLQFGIGPSLRLQLGEDGVPFRLGATYAGAASYFTETSQKRTYDQTLGVGSEWSGNRLQLNLRTGLQTSHNSSLDAGGRTGRSVFYAGGLASYQVGGKTTADLGGDFTQTKFESLLNSSEYRAQEYLNYQWSPKLQWGLGTTQGVVNAEASARQTYIQALVRIVTALSGKLDVNASAGNEWRNYESGTPSTTHPVFSAGAAWQATGKTNLTLDARRRTFASASLQAQNYESTSTSLSVHEMLTASLSATLSLGLEKSHYSASTPGIPSDRTDNYLFSRIGLDWIPRKNLTVGMFYEIGDNDSKGTQSHSFRRNRMGVSLNMSF